MFVRWLNWKRGGLLVPRDSWAPSHPALLWLWVWAQLPQTVRKGGVFCQLSDLQWLAQGTRQVPEQVRDKLWGAHMGRRESWMSVDISPLFSPVCLLSGCISILNVKSTGDG